MTKILLRIFDANANRTREGLRVVEEVARFILNHSQLTKRLKGARHHLDLALKELEARNNARFILHRESEYDVGAISFLVSERKRDDLEDLVTANFKRVEEGLRVLEEFSKMVKGRSADSFKALRFRVYTLEKDLHLAMQKSWKKRKK